MIYFYWNGDASTLFLATALWFVDQPSRPLRLSEQGAAKSYRSSLGVRKAVEYNFGFPLRELELVYDTSIVTCYPVCVWRWNTI